MSGLGMTPEDETAWKLWMLSPGSWDTRGAFLAGRISARVDPDDVEWCFSHQQWEDKVTGQGVHLGAKPALLLTPLPPNDDLARAWDEGHRAGQVYERECETTENGETGAHAYRYALDTNPYRSAS